MLTRTTEQNLRHYRYRRQNPRPKAELDKARKRRVPLPVRTPS